MKHVAIKLIPMSPGIYSVILSTCKKILLMYFNK